MRTLSRVAVLIISFASSEWVVSADREPRFPDQLDVSVPHVSTDPSIRIDYDIVYVRAGRSGDKIHKRYYTDFSQPVTMEPGADLMLLRPDGTEEVLVEAEAFARDAGVTLVREVTEPDGTPRTGGLVEVLAGLLPKG